MLIPNHLPQRLMLYLFYSLCSLVVLGLAMLIRAAYTAPEAIEDEKGFHLVNPEQARAAQLVMPGSQPFSFK